LESYFGLKNKWRGKLPENFIKKISFENTLKNPLFSDPLRSSLIFPSFHKMYVIQEFQKSLYNFWLIPDITNPL